MANNSKQQDGNTLSERVSRTEQEVKGLGIRLTDLAEQVAAGFREIKNTVRPNWQLIVTVVFGAGSILFSVMTYMNAGIKQDINEIETRNNLRDQAKSEIAKRDDMWANRLDVARDRILDLRFAEIETQFDWGTREFGNRLFFDEQRIYMLLRKVFPEANIPEPVPIVTGPRGKGHKKGD